MAWGPAIFFLSLHISVSAQESQPQPISHWLTGDNTLKDAGPGIHEEAKFEGMVHFEGGAAVLQNGGNEEECIRLRSQSTGYTLDAAQGFTFAVWVRFDGFPGRAAIIHLKDSSGDNVFKLTSYETTRLARIRVANGGRKENSHLSNEELFAERGQWAHVAVTGTKTGEWKLFRTTAATDITEVGFAPSDAHQRLSSWQGPALPTRTFL